MKTKMNFSDIAGMLERDEMREIVGGSGSQSGVGPGGSGGFYPSEDALGGSRIRSTFGYGSTFNGSGYTYGNSNYNNVVSKNNSGSASAMSSFTLTGNGNYTTNNSSEINVIYAMLYGSSTSHGINSIYQYAQTQAEANAALMIPSDAIHLNNVDVYRNPSGTNNSLNNIFNPNMNYNPNTNSFMGGSGSSNSNTNSITPSTDFLNSPFGEAYKKLISQNNNFLCLLEKFNPSNSFNLSLIYTSINMMENKDAQTNPIKLIASGKVIISAELSLQFDPTKVIMVTQNSNYIKTYERSEMGKVLDIVHEALHAYLIINRVNGGGDHTTFNNYRNAIINTLTEYNSDNNMGLNASQINELAFKGVPDSTQFKDYITGMSLLNNTSYDNELAAYNKRLSDLNWKLISVVNP